MAYEHDDEEGTCKQELSIYDTDRARVFAQKRTHLHRVVRNTPHAAKFTGQNFKVTGEDQDYLSILAEISVVRFLGLDPRNCGWVPYSESSSDYHAPDILGLIEVRRVTQRENPLVAAEKDYKAQAIVVKVFIPFEAEDGKLVSHEDYAELLGWQYAEKVWNKGLPHFGGSRKYHRMQPIQTLAEAAGLKEMAA